MKNKKYLVIGLVVVVVVGLIGLSVRNNSLKTSNDEEEIVEEGIEGEDLVEEGEVYIEYRGKIVDIENDEEKNNISILVKGESKDKDETTQEEIMFHLREDMTLVSRATMENIKREDLKEGFEISAFFKENTPMTLSMPPQTTPDAIVIHDSEGEKFVKVAHFNKELVDTNNELKLNVSEDTLLVNTRGDKVDSSDLEDADLMAFYTVSTKSIPAETNLIKVIVLDLGDGVENTGENLESEEVTMMEKLIINEKEFKLDNEMYKSDDRLMIPLIPIAEKLGYEVVWSEEEQSAELTKDAQWTKVTVGQDDYNFAKMLVKLGKSPEIKDDEVYVPVEFIEEVLRLDVEVTNGILEIK